MLKKISSKKLNFSDNKNYRRLFLQKVFRGNLYLLSLAFLSKKITQEAFSKNLIKKGEKVMTFELPSLPYDKNALEPHISEQTLNYHHGKHHKAYVDKLNDLIKDNSSYANKKLEEVIKKSWEEKNMPIFNNAAQVWNHSFYWNSMKPKGGGRPNASVLKKIEEDFGSFENFTKQFKEAGATQFGSGWAWLVLENDKLKIIRTPNAETPLTSNAKPLLTMDVWEHAYYLDYQNSRPNYMEIFINNLVNWDFVEQNLSN